MTTLHILNKPPSDKAVLEDCLRLLQTGDSLIFIEDGVYTALTSSQTLLPTDASYYVLTSDVIARGITERLGEHVEHVDEAGFVKLCCQHEKSLSWF